MNCFALRRCHFKSPIRTLLSNFHRAKFPRCFFLLWKKQGNLSFFFVALICYKDIIANLSNFVKTYFKIKLSLCGYYTTIKAYFSKFVKSFLQIFPVRFTTASVLTYYIPLDYSSWSRRIGQRVRLTIYVCYFSL